jgi:hypothetical protein
VLIGRTVVMSACTGRARGGSGARGGGGADARAIWSGPADGGREGAGARGVDGSRAAFGEDGAGDGGRTTV